MRVKIEYILVSLLLLGFILPIIVVNISSLHSFNIQCSFLANSVNVGSEIQYQCYGTYPLSSGDNIFTISLPGIGNIQTSYLSFVNVTEPIYNINISGYVSPNSQITQQVSIPSTATNILIYGSLQGIQSNGQYPSGASITGGNYPLYCSPTCIYNSRLIINSTGNYVLTISSGTGGGGVNYDIYGSYNLPYPTANILLNGMLIQSLTLSSSQIISLPVNSLSTVDVQVNGQPNANVLFNIIQNCFLGGGNWSCSEYTNPQNSSESILDCTTQVTSNCNLNNINIQVPISIPQVKYFSQAVQTNVYVNGVQVSADTSGLTSVAPYFVIYSLNQGTNNIEIKSILPFILSGAQTAIGSCQLSATSIDIQTLSGQPVNYTLYIKNVGNSPIQIQIAVPVSLSRSISVSPQSTLIDPGQTIGINIYIKGPISGEIYINGCSYESITMPISVSYTNPYIILIVLAAGLIVLFLAFHR
ncbi:MAG: hypothetical protein ACP5GJ_03590 [Nanopusillaceae archaeon]